MIKKVVFLALVACVVAAPRSEPRKVLISRTSEKVNSDSNVDARAVSSGNTNIQQDNLAKTIDAVNIKKIKGPFSLNLVQNTQADANQKTATLGGNVKASQNSQSNAERQLKKGRTLTVTKTANSKSTERVIANGKSDASQATNANTLQSEKINDIRQKIDASQKTRSNLKEQIEALKVPKPGSVKAAQKATSRAKQTGMTAGGSDLLKVVQDSSSQTNEQIIATGYSHASQRAAAKASDLLKGKDKKTGDNLVEAESSDAKSSQQLRVLEGRVAQSQRSKANEKTTLNVDRKKGANAKITERSSATVNGKVNAKGISQNAQQESAEAKESIKGKLDGELIEVNDSSVANANNKIRTKGGNTQNSQKSASKSNENLNARIL